MARTKKGPETVSGEAVVPVINGSIGGGLEGAERTSRETALWVPSMRSPDGIINPVKAEADARGQDISLNDGYAAGVVSMHRDSIVGMQYRLNAQPNWNVLGVTESWAEGWAEEVEAIFQTIAEDHDYYPLDAAGRLSFTDIIRLGLTSFVMTGEVLMSSEWITDDPLRPFRTAFMTISPSRLCNPNGISDSDTMRRGVERNARGQPIYGHIRNAHPGERFYTPDSQTWKRVPFRTKWGRWQLLHIVEQRLPDQTRGISEMVAVLKNLRMAKQFSEITLQNAVVNATFAAAIESDMPSDAVIASLGGGPEGLANALQGYLGALGSYLSDAKNIAIDGVKVPHLFPGTKFKLTPAGQPGGIGSDFEAGLLRKIAAALGVSYEELSKDYSKTNYSSARAGMLSTWRSMQSKKRSVADRQASAIYTNVVEELVSNGMISLPRGKQRSWFYEPMIKAALCRASWIGASRGQIDEMKETQAAVLRIGNNLSTLEQECARVGLDWRDVLRQKAREKKMMDELGLTPVADPAASNPSMDRSGSNPDQTGDNNQ